MCKGKISTIDELKKKINALEEVFSSFKEDLKGKKCKNQWLGIEVG